MVSINEMLQLPFIKALIPDLDIRLQTVNTPKIQGMWIVTDKWALIISHKLGCRGNISFISDLGYSIHRQFVDIIELKPVFLLINEILNTGL